MCVCVCVRACVHACSVCVRACVRAYVISLLIFVPVEVYIYTIHDPRHPGTDGQFETMMMLYVTISTDVIMI